jgi:hypothetical protein
MDEQNTSDEQMEKIIKDRPFHPVKTEGETTQFEMNEGATPDDLTQWCSELVDYIVENCEPLPPDLDMSKFEPL